jgi:small ligand-binding sensory domain FIST
VKFISITSRQRNTLTAATEILGGLHTRLREEGEDAPNLLFFFTTPEHARQAEEIAALYLEAWPEALVLGTTATGILHATCRPTRRPAMVVFAACLPDVSLVPVRMDLEDFEDSPVCLEKWQSLLRIMPDPRFIMLLADPFTTPVSDILESLNVLAPGVPVVGALSSGARRPGAHVLVLNERRHRSGLIGVALGGNIRADVMVSQGCRPIGHLFTVTKAERNVVHELSGVPAVTALREMVDELPADERSMLQGGLMLGQAVREAKESFGRGDFLVLPVVGVDQSANAITLPGEVDEGQTICFHVWDNNLVDDMQMLLLPQGLDTRAHGGILFGSWAQKGRDPNRSLVPVRQVERALGYRVPMAGFLSFGEIGPIRGVNYLHMRAAALALLRPADDEESRPASLDDERFLN